jgi:cellulose synthase/poly-beta-1,6-N-acetylglucosamine synthase-like glycosyltransferase
MEIIVMDDGSTDGTYEIVKRTFADEPRVKVFRKPNGGKSSALNEAIGKASADIVVAIDADTILLPDAIELLTRHFYDPALGAVAGNAVVGNRINLITRMQALEYVTSQNLDRRALEIFNAISVVPGAIGAWRRSALIEAKGYGRDTLAEDADLTIDLERLGWKVIYESRAHALTEAPQTLRAFLKQRFRWMFGTLQVAYKNLGRVGTLPRAITWITIPNVLVFQFAFTLLAPFMDAILLMSIGTAVMSLLREGDTAELHAFGPIAMYWLLFQTVDLAVAAYAMYLDGDRSSMRLLPLVLVQRFTYRQLLYWTAIRVLLTALRGQLVGWGKLLRTGTVVLAEKSVQAVPKSATE